jgi:hypothetical protein
LMGDGGRPANKHLGVAVCLPLLVPAGFSLKRNVCNRKKRSKKVRVSFTF